MQCQGLNQGLLSARQAFVLYTKFLHDAFSEAFSLFVSHFTSKAPGHGIGGLGLPQAPCPAWT